MLGQYSSATLIGLTIAPLAGGIIISSFMIYPGLIPYHMVYLVAALAAVPVLIMTLMYTDSDKISGGILSASRFRSSFMIFFSHAGLRATARVDMSTYFSYEAVETFLPLFLAVQGIGPHLTGILFAVQVLIIAGKTVLRVCRRSLQFSGVNSAHNWFFIGPFCNHHVWSWYVIINRCNQCLWLIWHKKNREGRQWGHFHQPWISDIQLALW